jgi:hypothetical protein
MWANFTLSAAPSRFHWASEQCLRRAPGVALRKVENLTNYSGVAEHKKQGNITITMNIRAITASCI